MVRHPNKTWTPNLEWISNGPCSSNWQRRTCIRMIQIVKKKSTIGTRWVLTALFPWFYHRGDDCLLWIRISCCVKQQFEVPEEEAEWTGLSLEEAVEKQRLLELKVKTMVKDENGAPVIFMLCPKRAVLLLYMILYIWLLCPRRAELVRTLYDKHLCCFSLLTLFVFVSSSRSLSLSSKNVWKTLWRKWLSRSFLNHRLWREHKSLHSPSDRWAWKDFDQHIWLMLITCTM